MVLAPICPRRVWPTEHWRPGGRAPAPARRVVSGPRRALRPRRYRAVVHCADLPPLHETMQRTGDCPLGEAGSLAHLGRPEPRRPRGREGRQDLPLPPGGLGGRRWAPCPLTPARGPQARPRPRALARRPAPAGRARGTHRPGGPGGLSATPSPQCGVLPRGQMPRQSAAGSAPRHTRPPWPSLRGTCRRGSAVSPCRLTVQAVGASCHPFLCY